MFFFFQFSAIAVSELIRALVSAIFVIYFPLYLFCTGISHRSVRADQGSSFRHFYAPGSNDRGHIISYIVS